MSGTTTLMIGRRIPVTPPRRIQLSDGSTITKWQTEWPSAPGEYLGPITGYTGDLPAVFFLKPNARDAGVIPRARSVQHVTSPPHTFRECPDGSLEIRASIGSTAGPGTEDDGCHCWLDEGHTWRQ